MRPPNRKSFHILVKSHPAGANQLTDFYNCQRLLCASYPPLVLTFEVIRFTGYGVIAEKPRVSHLTRIFPCTLSEKYALDRKLININFLMVTTSSTIMQSFGRAPAVGKCLCVFLAPSRTESGALFIRGGQSLNKYRVAVDFDSVFTFFRRDCPFRCTREFIFLRFTSIQWGGGC